VHLVGFTIEMDIMTFSTGKAYCFDSMN